MLKHLHLQDKDTELVYQDKEEIEDDSFYDDLDNAYIESFDNEDIDYEEDDDEIDYTESPCDGCYKEDICDAGIQSTCCKYCGWSGLSEERNCNNCSIDEDYYE